MYGALLLMAVSTAPLAPGQYREQWYGGGGIPHPRPYNEYFENRLNTSLAGTAMLTASSPLVVPSFASPAGGPALASLVVHLPANARLTIDGDPTRATSATRWFVTPPLEPGKTYHYDLKAEVVRDGKQFTETRRVAVRAGQVSAVAMAVTGQAVAAK
jgi:uncharacterized protein (TIGR03000 family)